MPTVKLCVKEGSGQVGLTTFDLPGPGPGQAMVRTSLTTICGSDIHLVDEFEMIVPGTPMGHEAVGVVEAVGEGVTRFKPGDRVVSCCLTSCGHCERCEDDEPNLCQQFGAPMNLLFGAQSEAFLVNGADYTLAKIPSGLDDRHAVLAADIMSTGFGAIERSGMREGRSVAIFAQGPVGLCATAAAKYYKAGRIIAVESLPERVEMARRLGADEVVDPSNAVPEIMAMTSGVGVDVAVEALGKQLTFENCLKVTRLGGTVSSVGVYGGVEALSLPTDGSFIHRSIVTTFCPAGTERMEQLLDIAESGQVDLGPLFTHARSLDDIVSSYDLFRSHGDGVIKIAIT
ncbi:MAG: zinc-binding dehydrogenase [Candidatus Binatia bacterium]